MKITKVAEDLTAGLAEVLDIPPERYESAERSYKSVGEWLERAGSRFETIPSKVYTQGSFRLGTAIRPISGDEHYDLDIVCEFQLNKRNITQQQLHRDLGYELGLYASSHGMERPDGWDRCWTLNYSEKAQFHMDVLPCVPDASRQRQLREASKVTLDFVEKSVAITDKKHHNFSNYADDWPISNPNGYADWFYQRMKPAFDARRKAMMLMEKRASISEIPEFRVKTPLQSSIQILKRHRDMQFSEQGDLKPSSIVITTLAAHAYSQESAILGSLFSILDKMDSFIEKRGDRYWIPNPSDPRENFAERWNNNLKLKDAFDDWLQTARTDFRDAAQKDLVPEFIQSLAPRMGRQLLESAVSRQSNPALRNALARTGGLGSALQRILDAPHRRPPAWPIVQSGRVEIISATAERIGFRPIAFSSDSTPLPKNRKLLFKAQTNVAPPFKVFWQVVNTGSDAIEARGLRGGFDEGTSESAGLMRKENTQYSGSHSIECFIVKSGYCVARSGPFIVNIQ